ncbi:hypothetical protein [Xenophilus azovorans]|uniref:hypothetical protein n=1 Tax=Xenophilus azovorans TaxID=151755 RepID=UPI0012ECD04F|nr:hypothetical protein [Xenophilus azovorans]
MTKASHSSPGTSETASKLLALASGTANRTKYGRFRELLVAIETALAAGVRREIVRGELSRDGLDLSAATFSTYLQRARSEAAAHGTRRSAPAASPAAVPAPAAAQAAAKTPDTTNSSSAGEDAGADWSPQAIRGLRNRTVDMDGLAKTARKANKGRANK